jgi:uncharacterized membrane protein
MFIAKKLIIVIYVIVCAIVAIGMIKYRKNSKSAAMSEREYYIKTFLTYFSLCLLTTPIIYGIYRLLKK